MSSVINDTNLPKCFINKIVSPTNDDGITVVRSGIQSMADIARWIKEFGQNTSTHWIVAKSVTEGQRIVCSKQYVCQYSSSRKAKEKNRCVTKDSLCQAKINFQVKLNTSYTRASDIHIREGLCGVIIIKSKHSHPIEHEDTLRFLGFNNSPLKDTFFAYFNSGMGVAESLKHNQHILKVMENNNKVEQNSMVYGKTNPSERTVRCWYDQWKKLENLKRRTEIAISKANASRTLSPSPTALLSPPHVYYQPQSPNKIQRSDIQVEHIEQESLLIKDDGSKDQVRLLINQGADDPLESTSSPQDPLLYGPPTKELPSQVIFEEVNVKTCLSPSSALDNCDAASIASQTLTVRNDEAQAFGEYVGLSLSRMNEYVRTIVIHEISRVIFEADMGKFDKQDADVKISESNPSITSSMS